MKLRHWNYTRSLFLNINQGVLVTILVNPWLQLTDINMLKASAWVFLTTILSNYTAKKSVRKGKKISALSIGLGIPLALALLWQLPIVYLIPLNLLLLPIGIRFLDYGRPRRFARDWALGSFFLVITASLQEHLGFQLGLGAVLFYFALGLISLIFWNATSLEREGLQPDYGGLGRSTLIFLAVVGCLALGLALLLSPGFLQTTMSLAGKLYNLIMDGIVYLIVRPFAWLLSPIFEWADDFEGNMPEMDLGPADRGFFEDHYTPDNVDPTFGKSVGWGIWLVLIAILFLVILYIYRRQKNRVNHNEAEKRIHEARESVFTQGEILSDLRGAWQTLTKPLRRIGRRWYRGDDPLLIIRDLYARFLVQATKKSEYPRGATPTEYAEKLSLEVETNQGQLANLTNFYNQARYGEQGDEDAVKAAKSAFQQLK